MMHVPDNLEAKALARQPACPKEKTMNDKELEFGLRLMKRVYWGAMAFGAVVLMLLLGVLRVAFMPG